MQALHRSIVVVDVAGFSDPARTTPHWAQVQQGLYEVLNSAFAEAGIDLGASTIEDRGDGALILLPTDVPKSVLADRLPARLVAELNRYNAAQAPEAAVRLRVGLHFGEVTRTHTGVVSPAINHAFRIVDAAEAKQALRASQGVLALIASERFYQDVIRHDPAADAQSYSQIPVSVKNTSTAAWLRLLDTAPAPDPPVAPPPVRTAKKLLKFLGLEPPRMERHHEPPRSADALRDLAAAYQDLGHELNTIMKLRADAKRRTGDDQ